MTIPDKLYDVLKWIVMIVCPALMTALGTILPACGVSGDITAAIVTIIGAIATFIGALIGISSVNYKENQNEDN